MQTCPDHPLSFPDDDPLYLGPILIPTPEPPPVDARVRLVTEILAYATDVPARTIVGRRGSNRFAPLRHLAMYLYANTFSVPATDTARAFGRDRTTAQYGFKRIEAARSEPAFDTWVSALEAALVAIPQRGGRA